MSLLGIERDGSSSDGFGPSSSTYTARPVQTTISGRAPAPRWASPWWLLFLALAVAEVIALGVRQNRVPTEADWTSAAARVRTELGPKDAIAVAPDWADPLLRLYLGDRMSAKVAGRSDLAGFERLWVLSIRGARAREAPNRDPDFQASFGRVRVERYDLGPSPVLYDFADNLPKARVEREAEGLREPCPLSNFAPTVLRGGLGGGVVAPRQRFTCDFQKPWLWVGVTTIEAIDLSARRCIWTHPQGKEPIAVVYRDVPLSGRIVLHAGLDYHDERDRDKAPVILKVIANGRELSEFVHRDGDGMARYEIDLRGAFSGTPPSSGELRFEVSTPEAFRRSFCWTGSIQREVRSEAP